MIDHIQPINIDKVWFSSRINNTIITWEAMSTQTIKKMFLGLMLH